MFGSLVIQWWELSFVIKITVYFIRNGFIPIYDEWTIAGEQSCTISQHLSLPQKWRESRNPHLKDTWFNDQPPSCISETWKMPPFHVESTRYHQTTTQSSNNNWSNMPKYKCPFLECTHETENVEDALAAVLLSTRSNGTHMSAPTNPTAKHSTQKLPKLKKSEDQLFRCCVKQGLELLSNSLAIIPWRNKSNRKRQSATTPGMLRGKSTQRYH